jgi:hypothetical protein
VSDRNRAGAFEKFPRTVPFTMVQTPSDWTEAITTVSLADSHIHFRITANERRIGELTSPTEAL